MKKLFSNKNSIKIFVLVIAVFTTFCSCTNKNKESQNPSPSSSTLVQSSVSSSVEKTSSEVEQKTKITANKKSSSTTSYSQSNSSSTGANQKTNSRVSNSSKYVYLTIDSTKGENGVVASSKKVEITQGNTVFDVLKTYCKKNNIILGSKGSGASAYVAAIDGIAEFDFGSGSGWLYSVNGKIPSVSCGAYKLSGGEKIKFMYTVDNGKTEAGE